MTRKIVELFLVCAIFSGLVSCATAGPQLLDGQVEALKVGSTVWGMQQAVAETAGTFRLMNKEGMVMFGWPLQNGYGFSLIDPVKTTIRQYMEGSIGNFANAKTIQDLIGSLKESGWREVSASELPKTVIQGLSSASGWLAGLASRTMPTFIFMPVAPLEDQMEKIVPEPQTQ